MWNRTSLIEEVRGVEKPFFVVCNRVAEPKVLHKKLSTAMAEMYRERAKGFIAGILFVDSAVSRFEVPLSS